jgi:butyrate kinase
MRVLVINPGSTSTKVAVYDGYEKITKTTIDHDVPSFLSLETSNDQIPLRLDMIESFLETEHIALSSIDAIISRGGILKPSRSGLYEVSEAIIHDLTHHTYGEHVANLGGIIAHQLSQTHGQKVYIADPESVDEMIPAARLSGLNGIERKSIFHALNQKSVLRKYAEENGKDPKELEVIVAHLGSGISIGFHQHGRVIDVNDVYHGEGPMGPERTGSLPLLSAYYFLQEETQNNGEIRRILNAFGGVYSYLNTTDMRTLDAKLEAKDRDTEKVTEALVYQIAKAISQYVVLPEKLDAIILTGGLAYSQPMMKPLLKLLNKISLVKVYPGEYELEALNRYLQEYQAGQIKLQTY